MNYEFIQQKPFNFLLNKQPGGEITEDEFFELIERLNANRLQDQRAEFPSAPSTDDAQNGEGVDEQKDGQDRTLNGPRKYNNYSISIFFLHFSKC